MQITDFSRPGILRATITKLSPKYISEGGFEGYTWTIEFASEIDSQSIDSLEGTIPSAMTYHTKAIAEKSYASISIKPVDSTAFIEFYDPSTASSYFDSMATVMSLKLNVNDKFQVFIGKMKVEHLDLEKSASLLYCLGRELVIKVEPRQQTMFQSANEPETRIGQIICSRDGSEILYGKVSAVSSLSLEVNDFGTLFSVEQPTAALDIEISQLVTSYYKKSCEDKGLKPSWKYLISGLASSDDNADGLVITKDVVDATLEIQQGEAHV